MKFHATDNALVASVGKDILVGKAFAFIGAEAWKKPALAWVARLVDGAARPRIVSLLGPGRVPLPGAIAEPWDFATVDLRVVTSDKALYRERRDEVHLFALDPLSPHGAATVEIRLNGAELAKYPVALDARGAASVTLRDLPPGDYEARLFDDRKSTSTCSFTVAAYRLAPLVAALADRRLEGSRLSFTLRLESFGSAVEGPVILELTDRGTRLGRETAEARAGVVRASFTLRGEGPHAINVQLASDASRTASVPIVGSRAAERLLTTFSTLGLEVQGSLLPCEGSIAVRGIHLSEGAVRSSPFRLDRLDTRVARITATADVVAARVVVIDPTYPMVRADAVDPERAPHPAGADPHYRRGEALFQAGKFAESRAAFEEALASLAAPHPNYAYYLACCFAREGDRVRAVSALRRAIAEGWKDFDLLRRDDDLAALRGYEPFEALASRGVREVVIGDVRAGQSTAIEVPAPMGVLAIAAYVQGEPWEGWAATLAPADMAPVIAVPERVSPGDLARVEIDTGRRGDDVSVYVVVKDARLLTPDTPESKLAATMKSVAERASGELGVGRPSRTLADVAPPVVPLPPPAYLPMPSPPSFSPPVAGLGAVAFAAPMAAAPRAGAPRAAPPPPPAPAPGAPAPAAAPGPYREAAAPPPPAVEEPEVIFAGLVETRAGRALVPVRLGPDFADYIVEAFAVSGLDWAAAERRFRAEKEVFASLDLPAFVHPDDGAVARVHVGSRGAATVRVTRDGALVPLLFEGRALAAGEALPGGRAELSFIAGPGRYEALVEDASGASDRVCKDVEVPGKLRRTARTVRILEPGERLSRDEDPSILGLRVLPGIDGPLTALVDATSDYGHACCEQTAAKMLAACAMYALADDRARRDRAESIILAGVRRESTMWLRGRGFKMYPESSPEPTPYWGPKAARHLWNLSMVRDLSPGRALASALDGGLEMAADSTRAYGLVWPPREVRSCEDAYLALRFGKANGDALSFVRDRLKNVDAPAVPASPHFGGAVAMRAEASYAAAALLRGGHASDRRRALGLANGVLKSIGPNGRLYSTVDSVAAIALAAELSAAKILGGGAVEIDGAKVTLADALTRADARAVRAIDAVAAVEVTRTVEEDWGAFGAALPIAVRLKKDGVVTRRLEALDAVDLEVTLEGGYKAGDLLWVCLPDALSRVVGGGQVKQFSLDFEGKTSLTVSLAATGSTVGQRGEPAPARFAVCVRNMFEEERGGSPGYIEVSVAPPAGGGLMGRVLSGLKGLFGG